MTVNKFTELPMQQHGTTAVWCCSTMLHNLQSVSRKADDQVQLTLEDP